MSSLVWSLQIKGLLLSREVMGAGIGEENVQRGRCDRDFGALACGPVIE